jgi:PEP-CTERM motif
MKQLFLIALPIALVGSPAMSATYSVDGWATGLAQDDQSSGTTSDSASGAAQGATFTANATNINGGSASAFASEGVADVPDYNGDVDLHEYGLDGRALADVMYTIRVSGPVTGALVPVHIVMNASATSLDVPDPVGGPNGYYAPVVAGASAGVEVSYAPGDAPVGASGDLADIDAFTSYNYKYFTAGEGSAPVVLGNTKTFNEEVMVAANFYIAVDVFASATAQFTSPTAIYTQTVEGGASADPTFTIDEPGYSAYTIEGVPAGPAAAATPEPATWAMMLIGFAGLGYTGYRRRVLRPV